MELRDITMTQEEKILIDKYLVCKKAEKEAKSNSLNVLKELAALAPHKVGEVVKWTEHKIKNLGTTWKPNIVNLPPVEKKAVVVSIKADIWQWKDNDATLTYNYEFRPIKKDGGVSSNSCYPNKDIIEWTGEIYNPNKE